MPRSSCRHLPAESMHVRDRMPPDYTGTSQLDEAERHSWLHTFIIVGGSLCSLPSIRHISASTCTCSCSPFLSPDPFAITLTLLFTGNNGASKASYGSVPTLPSIAELLGYPARCIWICWPGLKLESNLLFIALTHTTTEEWLLSFKTISQASVV